jgi:hypothetical protein
MARGEPGGGNLPPPRPFDPQSILATLERHDVKFVVIGAYAAVTQGWTEPTGDIDVTPDRDVRNLRRLVEALREMDAQVLTAEGEVDEAWPLDDQHLRLRETTFLATRFGDVDVVINPAAVRRLSRSGATHRVVRAQGRRSRRSSREPRACDRVQARERPPEGPRCPPPPRSVTAPPARRLLVSGERHGEWHEWPFAPLPALRSLRDHDVEYVLIGGLAAVLQGSPLPTYDIDITPAPGTRNQERLRAALAAIDAILLTEVDGLRESLRRGTDVSFYSPYGHIDLNHRPAGFESYAAVRRNALPIELEPGLTILVAPLRDIIRSRLAAGDHRQLPALEAALELS